LSAWTFTVHWTCLNQMNAFKTHFSVHFMFVCGVVSYSRESTVVPEIFTVLGCFTHHRFFVICWTAGPLKVGLIDVQNFTNYPSTLCSMPEVHRSHVHHGRSLESHSCTCVCQTAVQVLLLLMSARWNLVASLIP